MSGTVVLGLGNVICSDGGLGVHAISRLHQHYQFPADVELVEGGTAGLRLLPRLADADRAVLIDAVDVGAAPGTLVRLEGDDLDCYVRGVSARATGLADLLHAARQGGKSPSRLVLHGAQPAETGLGTRLSGPVAAALGMLAGRVAADLMPAPERA
ncbi:hydrogenase maturation protease [Amycolatopsis alkalitolerans]|nr:hydrogenase maturation protease [Amycolatopsis alkalitolerans]